MERAAVGEAGQRATVAQWIAETSGKRKTILYCASYEFFAHSQVAMTKW